MGAFTSAHSQIANEEAHVAESTPPPPAHRRNKRILNLDPRSPTENITRTPIVVDKTPSQSHVETPKAEKIFSSALLRDPRSPTTYFTRTPLGVGKPHQASQDFDVSVTASVSGTPVSHHSITSESGIESASVTPVFMKATNDENVACQSPDSAVVSENARSPVIDDNLEESGCSDTPCLGDDDDLGPMSSESFDDAPLLTRDLQNISISKSGETATFFQVRNAPEYQVKHRHFAFGKKGDAITMDSKSVRSPLAFVDNSPRYGRLQKSSTRPAAPSISVHTDIDKENICH